jgi:transcriptional regulator with XRE-family HTH domain
MEPFIDQLARFDERRRAARISYADISRATGIQKANLSRYRRGHVSPSMDQWVKINLALDALIAQRAEELRELA